MFYWIVSGGIECWGPYDSEKVANEDGVRLESRLATRKLLVGDKFREQERILAEDILRKEEHEVAKRLVDMGYEHTISVIVTTKEPDYDKMDVYPAGDFEE